MNTESVPRALADLTSGTITAAVWIDAPAERLFAALTSEEVTQWWGGAPYQTTRWAATVEVNGAWRAEGKSDDGSAFSVWGKFTEVDRPRKLAMTWNCDWDDIPTTLVTYRLEPINGGTKLTVDHTGFGQHGASCSSHAAGWEMVLGWLADYAVEQSGASK